MFGVKYCIVYGRIIGEVFELFCVGGELGVFGVLVV